MFEQIMDEFDNDNFCYENEAENEADAQMPKKDVFEPENNLMIEDEVPLILEQDQLDVEMNEVVLPSMETVDDDKENENPIELMKAPMPPPPVSAL